LGADVISGGPGNDSLFDGPLRDSAVDILEGGDGNDFLAPVNRPAARDIVSCGDGRDFAEVDRKDIVGNDCERVFIHRWA
jgi:Ca2+-binding RTX toxin-like protein